jgi:dCMP deaminase
VRDKIILSTGYNGSMKGMAHCDDVGHMMHDTHCIRTVHAEANAVAQAARNGTRIEGATAYVTALPCFDCFKLLVNAGIVRIAFEEKYRPERWNDYVEACSVLGIKLDQITIQYTEGPKDFLECALGS